MPGLPGQLAAGGDAAAAHDDLADSIRRQIRLRQESRCGIRGDEVCDVARRICRNQDDHWRIAATVSDQQTRKIEPALVTERNVDEDDVRPQLGGKLHSLSGCAGNAEDAFALPLKENARRVTE
jgi:hypothetical protein